MIGYLMKKGNYYVCSNCRMRQKVIKPYCPFCEYEMSNYETVILQGYKDLTNPQISSIIYTESEEDDGYGEERQGY